MLGIDRFDRNRFCLLVALSTTLVLGSVWSIANAVVPTSVSAIEMIDIDGTRHSPSVANQKALVVIFVNTDCPIANAFHPTLTRLCELFQEQAIDFVLVYSNPGMTQQKLREHRNKFSLTWPQVIDTDQSIAKTLKAKVSPEAFVLDSSGDTVYRGRIDDRFVRFGKKRPNPTTNDLQDVLQALVKGEPIRTQETEAIGCLLRLAK